ncbi:MAG: hypothetical protein WBB45_07050 [Cyclobacteriaceae bacterium]
MRYLPAILLFCLVTTMSHGQELKFGIGMTMAEREYYPAIAQIDSVTIYNRDFYGGKQLLPFVRYVSPPLKNFTFSAGLTYFRNYTGMTAYKQIGTDNYSAAKAVTVGIRSFEFPLLAHYSFFPDGDLTVKLFAGIIPVFSKIDFEPRFKAGNSLNWPQEVVDVMNKAGTLPKRFYMDYQYGGNITYKRFGLDVFIQQNLTKNINNNLEVYGQSALFTRKTESLRFLLSYSIPLFSKSRP